MSQPQAPTPLLESIAMLADLRKEVESQLDTVDWASQSHADTELLAFMQLAIGNVAAIETLAKTDVRFVMPGTAAARAAYEVVVTATWMVATTDLAERDRRWMALFLDERKFWRTLSKEALERQDPEPIVKTIETELRRVETMIADFQPQLDAVGGGTAKPMPQFDDLLQQVGKRRIYVVYKTACQIVHPATRALSLVRDLKDAHSNEPPVATFGYRTTERDWTTAVLLGAASLSFGLETLTRWLQAPQMSPRALGLFNSIVAKVKTFR